MFERFSQHYYLGRLYVTPTETDRVTMERTQHERVNEQLYASGDGVERLDTPLVMKLETQHFPVHGTESLPANTLAVPTAVLEQTEIDNPPALSSVFLASRDRARQLLQFAGWDPDTPVRGDEPDGTPPAGM
ncbi:hypothetical protein Halru_0736 [Halovivax ruber XH-70]|uniref:Uncharacterized protein n=2 Tax=Halovivax TaxID=332951 RepID=L0I980_HALRX|nr:MULTISPECIES: DUF5802 family protein [Halovivax]AGB15363.1 hypothetical protein Halru_0736 [Halovivax ruber XH-70]ELZ12131.1 hypothetical protein C479_04968 [Halovivax asiaticus JCM 14624]